MNNYRMGSYLLIAIGLINLRYQSGQENVLSHSLVIVIPGVITFLLTFIPKIKKVLEKKEIKALSAAIGLLLIAYAILN